MRATAAFPPQRASATEARRFAAERLQEWGLVDPGRDVELLVSELAANAVLHADTPFEVELSSRGGVVRISICDDDVHTPHPRALDPEAVTGRGLMIVDRVADRWGVDAGPDGKVVWCEIRLPREPVGSASHDGR